jgi:hypothetical protein
VGDEPLPAVEDVVVAVPEGPRPCRRRVRARLRLREREGDQLLPRGEGRDEAGLLLVRPAEQDRQRAERLDAQDQARGRARPRDLLDGDALRQEVCPDAAVLLGERQGQHVVRGQQPANVLGELAGAIDLRGPRRDLLVGQLAEGVPEEHLLLGQTVRPGVHHGPNRSRCGGVTRFGHRPSRSRSLLSRR